MTTPDPPTRTDGVRTAERDGSPPPTTRADTAPESPGAVPAATPVHDRTETETARDRVRWGPVWAGTLVVLTTFIVLQLLFFALGWLDLGFDTGAAATVTAVVSGVLGLIAFFVGGLTAAASTMWRGASDGILQGVLVWALGVAIIFVLSLLSGSAVLGPLANVLAQTPGLSTSQVNVDPTQLLDTFRRSAGWAALSLGLGVGAAALGGLSGAKLWSSRRDTRSRT